MRVPNRISRVELTYGTCETRRCSDWIRTSYPSSLRRFKSGLRSSAELDIELHLLLHLDRLALDHAAAALVRVGITVRHGVKRVRVLEGVREGELDHLRVGDLVLDHGLRPRVDQDLDLLRVPGAVGGGRVVDVGSAHGFVFLSVSGVRAMQLPVLFASSVICWCPGGQQRSRDARLASRE